MCVGKGFLNMTVCSHRSPKMENSNRHFNFFFSFLREGNRRRAWTHSRGVLSWTDPKCGAALPAASFLLRRNQGMWAHDKSSIYKRSCSRLFSLLAPKKTFKKKRFGQNENHFMEASSCNQDSAYLRLMNMCRRPAQAFSMWPFNKKAHLALTAH